MGGIRCRGLVVGIVSLLVPMVGLGPGAAISIASGPPVVGDSWTSLVHATTARLNAEVDPNGFATAGHFEYITRAAFEANQDGGKDGFSGAVKVPWQSGIGAEKVGFVAVAAAISGQAAETAYSYRVVAKSSGGEVAGPALTFVTEGFPGALLADSRGWEMVSPPDKNGGEVDPPEAIAGGGVLQAAAAGGSVSFGSRASFGPGATGSPPASQYISTRNSFGWTTQNVTAPLFSGSYDTQGQGVPYRLFSPDLARALLLNGDHCRGEANGCAVANPPLAGSGAPAGFQNYYLRDNATAGFAALLGAADVAALALDPAEFDVSLAGASPDLRHVILSTCAALTPEATEVALGEGCDPAMPNLYAWSSGAGLSLVNLLPGQGQGNPGAALGAQAGAVSSDGARIYWSDVATGNLYLRAGGQTALVDAGAFQTASSDGSKALFTKAGHLYRYDAVAGVSTDLTPGGEVVGVLGASDDASRVYYLTPTGLFLRDGGVTTEVAADAGSGNYPPTTGTARVSADGGQLLFVSTASLTGYDNTDLKTGEPDSEVYLYDAIADFLTCVSCNPTGERPAGPSSIPGAIANGQGPDSTHAYKPRALSANGRRVFFDSRDALVGTDTNNDADVYQWEAGGEGSCLRAAGCVSLISSGRSEDGASFVDAAADGADAFFLSGESLVGADPGAVDLYDARIGGGFAVPASPIACEGDSCQPLPSPPVDPTLTTLLPGLGNPPVRYQKLGKRRHHKKRHRSHRRKHPHREVRR